MTFSGDHIEPKSQWSALKSRSLLSIVVFGLLLLLVDGRSRGYALVGIALLVTIMLHEAGHFIAAKWAKMKATEFFIGFGPRIWSFTKGETEYGIKAIPLGGYVKIIGMTNIDEVDPDDEHRTYRRGQTYKKLIVIMAGVVVNILLAYLLIFTSLIGHGVAVDANENRAIIGYVSIGSSADSAGFKQGDKIIRVEDTQIFTFEQLSKIIKKYEVGDKIDITYLRNSRTYTNSVVLKSGVDQTGRITDKPALGITSGVEYKRLNPVQASIESAKSVYKVVDVAIGSMTRLFSLSGLSSYSHTVINSDYQRQDRPSSIAGIVNVGGEMVNQDIWSLFFLMALINIFLAILNALPILPLDGGHAAVAIFEKIASLIMRRNIMVNYKALIPIITIVVGLFMIFSLSALWLDLLQISS